MGFVPAPPVALTLPNTQPAPLAFSAEEKERAVAELLFDLRRARSAAAEGDWEQREEDRWEWCQDARKNCSSGLKCGENNWQ